MRILKKGGSVLNFPNFEYEIQNYTKEDGVDVIDKVKVVIQKYIEKPNKEKPEVRKTKEDNEQKKLYETMVEFGDFENNSNIQTKTLQEKYGVPQRCCLRTFVNRIAYAKKNNIIIAHGDYKNRFYKFTDDYIETTIHGIQQKAIFNPENKDVSTTSDNPD